ncbi:MAG: DNA repair protein RadC [Nitrospinota bacterium]|nr:DNA repair protein RadC [Nitrospinota bacterium]
MMRPPDAPKPYPTSIREWPEQSRPRERLLARGAEDLGEAELLAIILRTGGGPGGAGAGGGSALDLARSLLYRFGDLRGIENAGVNDLCSIRGIGPAKVAQIKAALELGRRFLAGREKDRALDSSEAAAAYFAPRLRARQKELFQVALLSTKNHLLKVETISLGSLNESVVHPREAFAPAVKESTAAVVFAHNHPSGDPGPSEADRRLTRRLKETGDLLGIRVLDHIIVGEGDYYSFADHGAL